MYYEINVSKNGEHLFATAERSLRSFRQTQEVFWELSSVFQESKGYKVEVSKWETTGEVVSKKFLGAAVASVVEGGFPFEEIRDKNGDYFSTVAEAKEVTGYDEYHIWSVTEGEGTWCYGPPQHYVNLLGYVVTKESHDNETYYEEKDWREEEELAEADILNGGEK